MDKRAESHALNDAANLDVETVWWHSSNNTRRRAIQARFCLPRGSCCHQIVTAPEDVNRRSFVTIGTLNKLPVAAMMRSGMSGTE